MFACNDGSNLSGRTASHEEVQYSMVFMNNVNDEASSPVWRKRRNKKREISNDNETYQLLIEILHHVRKMSTKMQERLAVKALKNCYKIEWRQVAQVCDRVLLITFFLMTTVTTITIFAMAPP